MGNLCSQINWLIELYFSVISRFGMNRFEDPFFKFALLEFNLQEKYK